MLDRIFRNRRSNGSAPTRRRFLEFELNIEQSESEGFVVLTAERINVSAFGESLDEAREQFVGAMDSFLHSLCEHGELQIVLEAHGIPVTVSEVVTTVPSAQCHTIEQHENQVRGRADLNHLGFALA